MEFSWPAIDGTRPRWTGAGFRVGDVLVDHIFPYRVSDYVEYRYRKAAPFRWLPSGAMRFLEQRLGWHLCLTARPR